jgi:hypothetical protein
MISEFISPVNLIPDEILAAAARGWKVFPILAGTKDRPLVKWGTSEPASSDVDQITSWANRWPGCNWGVATGQRSGIFGIDLDSADALIWSVTNDLPMSGYQVKSGKDSPFASHLYFRQPAGVRIKTSQGELAPGVDVRGDGGMLVIPPSIHPASGNRYSIVWDGEAVEAPQWLIDLVKDTRPERPAVVLEDLPPLTADQIAFGRNSFLKKCRKFSELPTGTGIRNGELNDLGFFAGGLIASGAIDREFADGAMREHAAAYIIEEGTRPAIATWESGLNAGMGVPWIPEAPAPELAGFGHAPLPQGASLTPVATLSPALTVPSGGPDELTPEDFWAHLPTHSYINRRTREHFSVDAVNGHLKRFADRLGMKPAQWLDIYHATQQMSWQPGHAEIIEGAIADKGHLRPDPKGRIYNLYRPSEAVASEADPSPWVNHLRLLYPDDADHLMKWFSYRIQNPGDKINHALVIGGAQGIGKDLLLEPLRYGVGKHNLADVNPADLFKDFTPWVESTLVIINEARDLGDVDRYKFYESAKRFITAPPDTLPCNKKHLASYDVPNVMGVIFTSNHKIAGLYIDPDDRRHYVAWCSAEKQPAAYFDRLWTWMHEEGGKQAVLGFLQRLNIDEWNAKEPPPKTAAWHQIVAANSNPEEATLSDALQGLQIATVAEILATVQSRGHLDLAMALMDRKNLRRIPGLLERAGFEALPNPHSKSDGRWAINGKRETLYADRKLSNAERLTLAAKKSIPQPPTVVM